MRAIPKSFGQGGIGGSSGFSADAIKALLAPVTSVVSGAAADTDITVTSMTSKALVLSAVMFDTGVPSALVATVQSNGKIQFSADSTGNTVVVTWLP